MQMSDFQLHIIDIIIIGIYVFLIEYLGSAKDESGILLKNMLTFQEKSLYLFHIQLNV